MKFEHTQVMNFENAFRGLRNPLESWSKSDSQFGLDTFDYCTKIYDVAYDWCKKENISVEDDEKYDLTEGKYLDWFYKNGILKTDDEFFEYAFLGPADLSLAQKMIKAGTSDRKFLRQILVSVDITAPLYFYKEFDTYKVATVANSTSTMHKLSSTPITLDCFETDDFVKELPIYDREPYNEDWSIEHSWINLINDLETIRKRYLETKDKKYWKELIRLLPESWLQTRTVTMNYEVLRNIYSQRKNHKLSEWHQFCDWIQTLPYAKELITYGLD